MDQEEKPDGIGIGDNVFSEKLNVGGVVKSITTCIICKSALLVIDDGEDGVHGYYHAESFKSFDPNKPFSLRENRWIPTRND